MSKTDNTQPLQLQWADTTRKGHVSHYHRKWGQNWDDGELIAECDYTPHNNLVNFRSTRVQKKTSSNYLACRCQRMSYHHGGKNSEEGDYKQKRKGIKRSLRTRERMALQRAQAYGLRKDGAPNIEFDLLPQRGDHGSIKPFAKGNSNRSPRKAKPKLRRK